MIGKTHKLSHQSKIDVVVVLSKSGLEKINTFIPFINLLPEKIRKELKIGNNVINVTYSVWLSLRNLSDNDIQITLNF